MGQYFVLVDLDGRVAVGLGKLGEGIWEISLHELLLPSPLNYLKPLEDIRRDCFTGLPALHPQTQSRLLAILPSDVLRLVFESFGPPMLEDMSSGVDVASFALTCQLCFEVGHPVLKRHQDVKKNTWTGNRIIIAGDYQDADDLPEGLELAASMKDSEKNIFSQTEDVWPYSFKDLLATSDAIFNRTRSEARSYEQVSAVRDLQERWRSMFGSQDRPRIVNPLLRNLTAKEYARGEALKKVQRSGDHGKLFQSLRIGDLVAFRIVWSSDPSVSLVADDNLVRGKWAGHRFDIVSQSEVDLEGWKDVSDELVSEVAKIYEENAY